MHPSIFLAVSYISGKTCLSSSSEFLQRMIPSLDVKVIEVLVTVAQAISKAELLLLPCSFSNDSTFGSFNQSLKYRHEKSFGKLETFGEVDDTPNLGKTRFRCLQIAPHWCSL